MSSHPNREKKQKKQNEDKRNGSYFSLSSKTLLARSCSKRPRVIQYGSIKPIKNNNIQKAIPPIKRNKTIPKVLMFYYF